MDYGRHAEDEIQRRFSIRQFCNDNRYLYVQVVAHKLEWQHCSVWLCLSSWGETPEFLHAETRQRIGNAVKLASNVSSSDGEIEAGAHKEQLPEQGHDWR